MKFKLSEHSVFAVLLRKPWWMSAGLAILLFVLGFAILPIEFAAMGFFAAVPFAAISLVAAVRQFKQPSHNRVLAVAEAVIAMPWEDFAKTISAGFTRDGCTVERLKTPGADLALNRDGKVALVSARRWKAAHIGVEPLRELQNARSKRDAREAIFIALGDVSDNAWQYAKENNISLMAGPELAKLLRADKF